MIDWTAIAEKVLSALVVLFGKPGTPGSILDGIQWETDVPVWVAWYHDNIGKVLSGWAAINAAAIPGEAKAAAFNVYVNSLRADDGKRPLSKRKVNLMRELVTNGHDAVMVKQDPDE